MDDAVRAKWLEQCGVADLFVQGNVDNTGDQRGGQRTVRMSAVADVGHVMRRPRCIFRMPGGGLQCCRMDIARHGDRAGSIAIADISDHGLGVEIAEADDEQQRQQAASHEPEISGMALAIPEHGG